MYVNLYNLELCMARQCFSYTDLAHKAGVSTATMCKVRTNGSGSTNIIGKIAKALDVDVAEIASPELSSARVIIDKDKVKKIAKEKHTNIARIAEEMGVTKQNVHRMVSYNSCRPTNAAKIASALGVDVSDIISKEVIYK